MTATVVRPAHPVLLKMAELLMEHGWCQGTYEDTEGRLCVMGAFLRTLELDDTWPVDDEWETPYYLGLQAFERSISPEMGGQAGELWDAADWNDRPGRTRDEVVARLRQVGWEGA